MQDLHMAQAKTFIKKAIEKKDEPACNTAKDKIVSAIDALKNDPLTTLPGNYTIAPNATNV